MKPIVLFKEVVGSIQLNAPAYVYPLNHPSMLVSNTTVAHTSPVVNLHYNVDTGDIVAFETENTQYINKAYEGRLNDPTFSFRYCGEGSNEVFPPIPNVGSDLQAGKDHLSGLQPNQPSQ